MVISRFTNALRQAIYALDCPLASIANGAKVSRSTVYEGMHGKRPIMRRTAKSLTVATLVEIDGQIERRQAEIDRLRQYSQELRGAYNADYGGGYDDGRWDDRPKVARRMAEE